MLPQLMYFLPMMLGRTFNLNSYNVGVDLFSPEDVKSQIRVTSLPSATYVYGKYVEKPNQVGFQLSDGVMSLKVKAGQMETPKGPAEYAASVLRMVNSLDYVFTASYEDRWLSFPYELKPLPKWSTVDREHLGTHYVSAILYGRDLIARVRFTANTTEDLEYIRAADVKSDILKPGRLERLAVELKGRATLDVEYYSNFPLEGVPKTFEGLRRLIRNFKDTVQTNPESMVPVKMDLNGFDFENFNYTAYTALKNPLGDFDRELEDLIQTEAHLDAWLKTVSLDEQQMKQVLEFSYRLDSVRRLYDRTIANLDTRKGPQQLDEAKRAYRENVPNPDPYDGGYLEAFRYLELEVAFDRS